MIKAVKNICDGFRKVFKSESVKEMFINIPWIFPEFLIFACMFILMLLPLYQLNSSNIFESYIVNITMINEKVVIVGVLAVVIIAVKQKSEKGIKKIFLDKTFIFFGFTIIMMIVSTVINGFTDFALCGHLYRNESLFTYIIYFAGYFYLSSMISSRRFKALLLYAYVSASVIMAAAALIHTFSPVDAFVNPSGLALIFRNYNHYAYYVNMAILISSVLFIKENNISLRIFCLISFVLNTTVLVINNTFGCYLASFFGLIFSVVVLSLCEKKLNKLTFVMIAAFGIITFLVSLWSQSIKSSFAEFATDVNNLAKNNNDVNLSLAGNGRWGIWCETVSCIIEKPLFGFGVEGTSARLYDATLSERPHCEFLQYAVFFGIPAAVSYVCGVFSVYLNGLKRRYELDIYTITALVAAFGYLVSSAFGNTTHYISPYFFIFLGMGFSRCENN